MNSAGVWKCSSVLPSGAARISMPPCATSVSHSVQVSDSDVTHVKECTD